MRATLLGMAANTLLAAGKLAAGVAGRSHALTADAVESLADVFSSIVVWRGVVVAAAPEDADHPYGHGKAEAIASALVSTMLLLAAGGIAVHSVKEILAPSGEGPRAFTLAVLFAVVVIKEGLFRFVAREAALAESLAVETDAWHHRSDVITSLAAAVGIAISLIGGKGYESADDVAALLAAAIIAWNGWRLLRPALDELMDAAPDAGLVRQIRAVAGAVRGVAAIEKCIVRKSGRHYLVDMHMQVEPEMTVREGHALAHQVKDGVRAALPRVRDVLVHIEPVPRRSV